MKAKEVFPFIGKLFARGVLPKGRNMWAVAYNIEEYTEACEIAEKEGLDIQTFQEWLLEYTRRAMRAATLNLPMVVRWEDEKLKAYRSVVNIPVASLKDFENLEKIAEISLKLEIGDILACEYIDISGLRVTDTPDIWARIEYEGEVQEIQINPVRVYRGEEAICKQVCGLQNVEVQEWGMIQRGKKTVRKRYEEYPKKSSKRQKQDARKGCFVLLLIAFLIWLIFF